MIEFDEEYGGPKCVRGADGVDLLDGQDAFQDAFKERLAQLAQLSDQAHKGGGRG